MHIFFYFRNCNPPEILIRKVSGQLQRTIGPRAADWAVPCKAFWVMAPTETSCLINEETKTF